MSDTTANQMPDAPGPATEEPRLGTRNKQVPEVAVGGDGDLVGGPLGNAAQPFARKAPQVGEQHSNLRVGVDRRIFGTMILCT